MTDKKDITGILTKLSSELMDCCKDYARKSCVSQQEIDTFSIKKDSAINSLKASIDEIRCLKFRQYIKNKINLGRSDGLSKEANIDKFYFYIDSLNKVKTLRGIFKYNKSYCHTVMDEIVSMYFDLQDVLVDKINKMKAGLGTQYNLYRSKMKTLIDNYLNGKLEVFASNDALELIKKDIPEYEMD